MKVFYFILFWTGAAFAEQSYFTEAIKQEGLAYYEKEIYKGCSDKKKIQDAVSLTEMKKATEETLKIVEAHFSRALNENPKVHLALKNDLNKLALQTDCQKQGNSCRVKVVSLAVYYYQMFRADVPFCQNYVKKDSPSKDFNPSCEREIRYRPNSLSGVTGRYGQEEPSSYQKEITNAKNGTTAKIFSSVLVKDKANLYICNIGSRYASSLDLKSGDFLTGMDPDFNPSDDLPNDCVEEKKSLASEFILTSFDEGRSTVGRDQVDPVKLRIQSFIKENPYLVITDVTVTASSSKAPFYVTIAGKKLLDPKSDERNLALANERAAFASTMLKEFKASSTQLSHINFVASAELAGPDFNPKDLNDRFVSKMTPDYSERIAAFYNKHKDMYEKKALRASPQELEDEKQFANLFQVKYKPFQGFRIQINGYRPEELKCLIMAKDGTRKKKSTKQ